MIGMLCLWFQYDLADMAHLTHTRKRRGGFLKRHHRVDGGLQLVLGIEGEKIGELCRRTHRRAVDGNLIQKQKGELQLIDCARSSTIPARVCTHPECELNAVEISIYG